MPSYHFKDKTFKTKRRRDKYVESLTQCPVVNERLRRIKRNATKGG